MIIVDVTNLLMSGSNILAVEVHQHSAQSTDLSFDLEMNIVTNQANIMVEQPLPWSFHEVWRFFADSLGPAQDWHHTNYNDQMWQLGHSELGYGSYKELTSIPSGSVESRYTTTYFRKSFRLDDTSNIANLVLDTNFDDGVVIYLNGHEVGRANMPSGSITYNTLANQAAEGNFAHTTFVAPKDLLVEGINSVSAEVHQHNISSSDLTFSLAARLVSITYTPPTPMSLPLQSSVSWEYSYDAGVSPTWMNHESGVGTNWVSGQTPFGYGSTTSLTNSGTDLGTVLSFGSNAENKLVSTYFRTRFVKPELPECVRTFAVQIEMDVDDGAVVYLNGVEVYRANMGFGEVSTDTLAARTVGGIAMRHTFFVEGRSLQSINALSVSVHQADVASSDLYFDLKAKVVLGRLAISPRNVLRYTVVDDDTGLEGQFISAQGRVGYTNEEEKVRFLSRFNRDRSTITTRYRHFMYLDKKDFETYDRLVLSTTFDDGVVFWLRREIARSDMPEGEISSNTLALQQFEYDQLGRVYALNMSDLRVGRNVLFAEVHQVSSASSDLEFAAMALLERLDGKQCSCPDKPVRRAKRANYRQCHKVKQTTTRESTETTSTKKTPVSFTTEPVVTTHTKASLPKCLSPDAVLCGHLLNFKTCEDPQMLLDCGKLCGVCI
eukprot:m.344479 g.344479  ORF g.344479 m.344479 type:complete len:663 (+) comp24533_c0_seq1:1588-3576(+)